MAQHDDHRQLREEINARIAATLPPDGATMLVALLRSGDRIPLTVDPPPPPRPGWNLALRLCLAQPAGTRNDTAITEALPAEDAAQFLAACDQLALAAGVLARCASGQMQAQQQGAHQFVAWATSRRLSPEGRERADFDWWSAHVARRVAPRLAELLDAHLSLGDTARRTPVEYRTDTAAIARYEREIGAVVVARFACQHSYPPDAAIGGATFAQYTAILARLIAWLLRARDGQATDDAYVPAPQEEHTLIAALAQALGDDPATIGHALQCFILDRDNAAYHSGLPGHAAPPLIRLDDRRLLWSARGLLDEPLIFLTRELRRRYAQEYHNRARLREEVFRHDLSRLFSDKRFALSTRRVELKRSGEARTDLDALVFDRKTGTLGIFELKAQDPFARSTEERQRQRDNFYHANRQVSAILEWVQRHGPDDLLSRFDETTAKRFHVQKVFVFVLGRYLAHFTGGPEPDPRAAWGSWSQVLQIAGNDSFAPDSRNPLGTLFTRLRDAPPAHASAEDNGQTIAVGDFHLRVYPSFAAMRAAEDAPA